MRCDGLFSCPTLHKGRKLLAIRIYKLIRKWLIVMHKGLRSPMHFLKWNLELTHKKAGCAWIIHPFLYFRFDVNRGLTCSSNILPRNRLRADWIPQPCHSSRARSWCSMVCRVNKDLSWIQRLWYVLQVLFLQTALRPLWRYGKQPARLDTGIYHIDYG